MTDFYLPQDIVPGEARWGAVESSAIFPADTTGAIRSSEIVGGNALNPTFVWPPLKDQSSTERQRSRLISVLRALRGQANRIWMPVPGHEEPSWAPELLSNNTFANGTTGWTADNCALTVVDRTARMTVTTPAANVQLRQAVALTQYAPYALRGFIVDGPQTAGLNIGPSLTLGAAQSSPSYTTERGMRTVVGVAEDATSRSQFPVVFSSVSGFAAGAFLSVPYTSLARCALVDNGPNMLLQSDDFTTTWTNINSTDAANSTTAPDGTSTADSIIEDASASTTHLIRQGVTVSSAAADYAFSVALRAGTRSFARVAMREATGGHDCYVDVNLSTGALGTATVSSSNWTNPRAFSRDIGGGWWAVTIVGRKANAATSLTMDVYLATALGTVIYTGDGASLIYAWRGTLAQSSVPTRLVQTTTTAIASGTAQSGTGLYVKGLPASTNDLRKAGHWVQIGRELHQLAANLNSDAAGMAFMQLCNPPRNAPADNDPIIVCNPMGKFLQAKNVFNWKDMPGVFSDFEVEFLEATAG